MGAESELRDLWLQSRERLVERRLLAAEGASLSIRCPDSDMMWFGLAADGLPMPVAWTSPVADEPASIHAAIYRLRPDAGAIAGGGGFFGARLVDFGGFIPQVFDEQARHLGPMGDVVHHAGDLPRSLSRGGNAILIQSVPFCLGTTAMRMAQNVELFEKCATAYVLAIAAGGPVKPLPWLVRWIANGRLRKDQRRATERFAAGLLPEESRGY